MEANANNSAFTPLRNTKPIDPVLRFGMEMNYKTIYVVFTVAFPRCRRTG